jgi:hypothetical protein
MVDLIQIFADAVGLFVVAWGTWVAGILMAQVIKLMPLLIGLAGSLSFHRDFPMDSYNGLKTQLKMAPLEFLLLPFRYSSKMIESGDLLGLIAGWIAIPIFMFLFLIGIYVGIFYVSILRFLLRPVRFVVNLN